MAWILTGVALAFEIGTRGLMVRTLWREFIRLFVIFDLQIQTLVQRVKKPRYVVRGGCQKRGLCCTQIIGNPPAMVKRSFLRRWFAAYHRAFHNFRVVGRGPDDSLIFACGHLKSDGRCGIYRYRPRLCRNYPVMPYFEPSPLLPGCGYRVVLRELAHLPERESLRILNPTVSMHHPTPPGDENRDEEFEDYHWVDTHPDTV